MDQTQADTGDMDEGNQSAAAGARNEPDLQPSKIIQGKDELNLAEFPLSAIADRVEPDQKTLVFEDRIWDESRSANITRQLTITASDQYGLPTALDDEVILGLVQISKLQDFAERRVSFTRYQLIQLLGWSDDGKSYERLEKSLNRWVGVTLYYKNAWWDRENRSWVDEKFHIIDNVTLYDREKAAQRRGSGQGGQGTLPLSTFMWNDVLFRSFKAGNLKSLDFDFYKMIKSPIAKRLYRFLDKRFFHRSRWEFNLKEISWEHIGLSRNYETANLKRKMLPGIRELEEKGFLETMNASERFRKIRSGEWRVIFEKARGDRGTGRGNTAQADHKLVEALVQRGVTPSTAEHTAANYPPEQIMSQLEVFDWLVTQKDPKVSRNPAGFLVSAIKSEYVAPKGFESREERERKAKLLADRKRRAEERERLAREVAAASERAREEAIRRFWCSQSDEERRDMERDALAQASTIQQEVLNRGGRLAEATRKSLLDAYALRSLQQAA